MAAAWELLLHDEAVQEGCVSATGVLDLEKAFEHVAARHIWELAPGLGFRCSWWRS